MDQDQTTVETGPSLSPQQPQMRQTDAVLKFIHEALALENQTMEEFKAEFQKDKAKFAVMRKTVREKLYAAIKAGIVTLETDYDDSKLKKYCSGLFSTWVAKNTNKN